MTDLKDDTMIWWCENQQWAATIPDGDSLSSCGYTCGPMKFEYLSPWAQDQLREEAAVGKETP